MLVDNVTHFTSIACILSESYNILLLPPFQIIRRLVSLDKLFLLHILT